MAWKRICGANEVPENTAKKFDVDGIPILLVNYGEGYRAIPPICPHMEEPLEEFGRNRALRSHLYETSMVMGSQDS